MWSLHHLIEQIELHYDDFFYVDKSLKNNFNWG